MTEFENSCFDCENHWSCSDECCPGGECQCDLSDGHFGGVPLARYHAHGKYCFHDEVQTADASECSSWKEILDGT